MSVSLSTVASSSLPLPSDGSICTPGQQVLSDSSHSPLHCLSRGQNIGLAVLTITAFVSFFAVCYIFFRILLNVIREARSSPNKWRLVEKPMDVYMISLFCANFFHAIGNTLNIKWLHQGVVETGHYCNAQGFILQSGSMALGLTTLLIAVHTFVVAWWSRGLKATTVSRFAVCFVWLMTFVFVAAFASSHRDKTPSYYSPVPYWCWVSGSYLSFGIAGEYLWLWLALLISLLMYIPLTLLFLGYISVRKGEPWWKCHWNRRRHLIEGAQRQALIMIIYPLAFTVLILPLSIVRYIHFAQGARGKPHLPSRATFAGAIVYNLSGLVEVVLFLKTRQGLLLFGENNNNSGVAGHGSTNPGIHEIEMDAVVEQENGAQ